MAIPRKVRSWSLPVAMVLGILFHRAIDHVAFLPPYLIFAMLAITFTRVSIREIRIGRLHWILLAIQLLGGMGVYLALRGLDVTIAQGVMISVMAPAAMASVVVTGMLGGNVISSTIFCMVSNMSIAFVAPLFFTAIGANPELGFWQSVFSILSRVGLLLLLPFIVAWLLEKVIPRWHSAVRNNQDISFWLWVLCMAIVSGTTVSFILQQPDEYNFKLFILVAASLVLCVLQFTAGWLLGGKYNDRVASGQGLGQKNNVLAIWLSQTYLDPLSSVAPAVYVIWQNVINGIQLSRNASKEDGK